MMQELFAVLTLLAIILTAGYLVWLVNQPRCLRCGKRLSKQDDYVDICDECFCGIMGEVKDVMPHD